MPGKRDDGATDLTVVVLREIRDEVRELRGEAKETNARLDGLQVEMRQGFETLGNRIDNLLLGEHRLEHEELRGRVERIERHLGLEPQ